MKHSLCALAVVVVQSAGGAQAAPPADCGALTTQAERAQCVFADFEAASADYAKAYADLRRGLPAAQRQRALRMQKSWLSTAPRPVTSRPGHCEAARCSPKSAGAARRP